MCKKQAAERQDAIVNFYSIFFESLEPLQSGSQLVGRKKIIKIPYPLSIFTTNYDLIPEIFLKHDEFAFNPYYDGFTGDYLNLEEYEKANDSSNFPNSLKYRIRLFKLHGSIDYRLTNDGRVKKSFTSINQHDSYGNKIIDNLLILPMKEKYMSMFPYFNLLQFSKKNLTLSILLLRTQYLQVIPTVMMQLIT